MIEWSIAGVRGVSLPASSVEASVTWTVGRRDYTSAESGSTLEIRVPWRAVGTRPAISTGGLVALRLGHPSGNIRYFTHAITDVRVDDDLVTISATSPEWRRLDSSTLTVAAGSDTANDLIGTYAPILTPTVGFATHPDGFYGPGITWTAQSVGSLFRAGAPATLFGRLKKAHDSTPGTPEARFTVANAHLAAVTASTGRTSITVDPSWIARGSVRAVRSVLNGANVIRVAGNGYETTRDTGLDSGIEQSITTLLDDSADVDAIADDLEDAWTDLDSQSFEGWLVESTTILLDVVDDDIGDAWVDLATAAVVDLAADQPITRVELPVLPPSSPGGSWTFGTCYVEGATLNLTRGASTMTVYAVPESLLRPRDVLDIVGGDLVQHYDATQQGHTTLIAGGVSAVDGAFAPGTLTQGTAAERPIIGNISERPSWRYQTGADDRLISAAFTLSQPLTIAVVMSFDAVPTGNRYVIGDDNLTTVTTTPRIFATTSGFWRLVAGTALTGTVPVTAGPHVLLATFNGASSELRVDGTVAVSGNPGTNGYTAQPIIVGGRIGSNLSMENGDIGELAIIDRVLTAAEKLEVETSLRRKWRLP